MTRELSKVQIESSHEGFQAINDELRALEASSSQPQVIVGTIRLFNRLVAIAHEVEPYAVDVLCEQLIDIQNRVLAVLQEQKTEGKAVHRSMLRWNNNVRANDSFGHGRTRRSLIERGSQTRVESRRDANARLTI